MPLFARLAVSVYLVVVHITERSLTFIIWAKRKKIRHHCLRMHRLTRLAKNFRSAFCFAQTATDWNTTMTTFDKHINSILSNEGGYSNDVRDSGGETNWGITVAVARAFGFTGPMVSMTREQASVIYKARYWDALRLDYIGSMSEGIAGELFDTGVNQGVQRAGEYLQRALNVLNNGGAMYQDITVDGRVGPVTVACLREYLRRRGKQGEVVMLRALNCLQGAFYIGLAETRPKDEAFVYGWLSNRVA